MSTTSGHELPASPSHAVARPRLRRILLERAQCAGRLRADTDG